MRIPLLLKKVIFLVTIVCWSILVHTIQFKCGMTWHEMTNEWHIFENMVANSKNLKIHVNWKKAKKLYSQPTQPNTTPLYCVFQHFTIMDPIVDTENFFPQLKDVEVKSSRRVLFDLQGLLYFFIYLMKLTQLSRSSLWY